MKYATKTLMLGVAIAGWVTLFVFAVTQNSYTFYTQLLNSFNVVSALGFIASWTWTNLIGLACLASVIGELGRDPSGGESPNLPAATARGFFIYLAFVAGQLVMAGALPQPEAADEATIRVSQGLYFRVASFSSMLAFLGGYSPSFFATVLSRLASRNTGSHGDAD